LCASLRSQLVARAAIIARWLARSPRSSRFKGHPLGIARVAENDLAQLLGEDGLPHGADRASPGRRLCYRSIRLALHGSRAGIPAAV
jgi:hypothetical protein